MLIEKIIIIYRYVDQLIIKYMADPSNVANLKRRNTKKKEVASKYNY